MSILSQPNLVHISQRNLRKYRVHKRNLSPLLDTYIATYICKRRWANSAYALFKALNKLFNMFYIKIKTKWVI